MLRYSADYVDKIIEESELSLSDKAWTDSDALAPYYRAANLTRKECDMTGTETIIEGARD